METNISYLELLERDLLQVAVLERFRIPSFVRFSPTGALCSWRSTVSVDSATWLPR